MTPKPTLDPAWQQVMERLQESAAALAKGDLSAREPLIEGARALISSLETPSEFIMRSVWAEPARNSALQLGIDLALFTQLKEAEGRPSSSEDLARSNKADPELVRRTMKHLTAMNIVQEVAYDSFKSTAISDAMTVPKYRDGIPFCMGSAGPTFLELPKYLAEHGLKDPVGVTPSPFQYSHHTEREYYEWAIHENPENGRAFNSFMMGYRDGAPKWTDEGFYPAEERLGTDSSDDEILLVDVGGGKGHDLLAFHTTFPALKGRLLLQEKPAVLSQISSSSLPSRIEKTPHDFFTPQPPSLHGAHAYHLHSILHNWSDADCTTILKHLAAAMKKNKHSKLLIFENVVPDRGASWKMTSLDWLMMANCATVERTEKGWRGLLGAVGLRVVRIWTVDPTTESLIEAVLEGAEGGEGHGEGGEGE